MKNKKLARSLEYILNGLLVLVLFFGDTSFVWAKRNLVFETYEREQKQGNDEFVLYQKDLKGRFRSDWILNRKDSKRIETYQYDNNSNVMSWSVDQPDEETSYNAVVKEENLTITGKLKGQLITKKIDVAGLPLYANPKIGLMKVFQADKKSVEFWGIRNDSLSRVKMVAIDKGVELFQVNGEMVRAHRIYWKCKMIPEYFFNRTYWFRESDGLFVGQDGSNDVKRRLIQESTDNQDD